MKPLGIQINKDGKCEWRNNGGIIERRFLYANNKWETVAEPCPHTPEELKSFCEEGGFDYLPPKTL
jgi:hypothetical protein